METESEMGPSRFRAYLIIGLIVGLAFAGAGVGALLTNGGPVLGWFMVIAGIAIAVLSAVRLGRANR